MAIKQLYSLTSFTALGLSLPLAAADFGDLSIGGYVDSILEVSSLDENNSRTRDSVNDPGVDTNDDFITDFSAKFQLELYYKIGEDINTTVEITFDRNQSNPSSTNTNLEQAFITWSISPNWDITLGRFHDPFMWEAPDAPDLYRVNHSIVHGLFKGADPEGIRVTRKSDTFEITLTIADSFYTADESGEEARKELADLDAGIHVRGKIGEVATYGAHVAYATNNTVDSSNEESNTLALAVHGTANMWQDEHGLLFAFDLHYKDNDWRASYGALGMVNWAFGSVERPMSLTVMAAWIEPNDTDTGDTIPVGKSLGTNDQELELAIALLTNPTADENFAANLEFRYIDRGDLGTNAERSEVGIFAEFLAVIP